MTPNDYQKLTEVTWNFTEDYERRIINAALGIGGESGEVLELIKKASFHGKPLDKEKLTKELGDVLYYAARLAGECGLQLEYIMEENIKKLKERYPRGFQPGGGIRES